MPTFTVGGEASIEEGVYPADLASIEEGPVLQYGPTMRFNFNVYVDGDPQELDALVSYPKGNATPKSKLVKFAKALMGADLAAGDSIDLDALVGKKCRVMVKINDNGYSTIAEVLAPGVKKGAAAAAAATA